jgi:methyl-accepting chemotaxis protein
MTVALSAVMVFLQDAGGEQHKIVNYSFIIALALSLQAAGVLVAAVFAMKMFVKVQKLADSFEEKTAPVIANATELIADLTPKIKNITTNIEDMSYTAKVKVDELSSTIDQLNRTVQDVNERSRVQVSRVDGIVSDVLATTYEVSRAVQEGIKGPVRQMAGVVAGLKAGLDTLIARSPFKARVEEDPYDL